MTAAELIKILEQLPPGREIASQDENGLMTHVVIGADAATDPRFPGSEFFVLLFGHEY